MDFSKIHASVLDSEGEETHGIMRFHLNSGQTSAVNHTQERGGDTLALPHSLGDYEGSKTEAQGGPQDPWLVLGFEELFVSRELTRDSDPSTWEVALAFLAQTLRPRRVISFDDMPPAACLLTWPLRTRT